MSGHAVHEVVRYREARLDCVPALKIALLR